MDLRRYGNRIKRAFRQAPSRAYYHACRLLPRDRDLAVFASYWYRGYSCNPAAIYEKARELAPSVRGVWVVEAGHRAAIPAGVAAVTEGSLAYLRVLARATWLVNNVNYPDFVVKRRGSVHVQTHHGTPVKVMGLELTRFTGGPAADDPALRRRCGRWDYSISANAHTTESWRRAYPGDYQTLEVGYPRNDRLALAGPAEVAAARARLELAPHQQVVLYAPTHRGKGRGYKPLLDVDALADSLGPDYVVLHRAHYFYEGAGGQNHPRVLDVSAYPSVEELLLAADVLLTDYSSIMFDFAVLDRPIVLYVPDWDWYRAKRGVTFDLVAEPPGVVTTNQPELVEAFVTGAVAGESAAKDRAEFRRRFCYLDDGRAAERVVRTVFNVG